MAFSAWRRGTVRTASGQSSARLADALSANRGARAPKVGSMPKPAVAEYGKISVHTLENIGRKQAISQVLALWRMAGRERAQRPCRRPARAIYRSRALIAAEAKLNLDAPEGADLLTIEQAAGRRRGKLEMPDAAATIHAPALLTAEDLAGTLQIARGSVWRNLAAGRLPSPVRVGGATRWRTAEIAAWITAGCPPAARWAWPENPARRA